jgi:hypothetical protein
VVQLTVSMMSMSKLSLVAVVVGLLLGFLLSHLLSDNQVTTRWSHYIPV